MEGPVNQEILGAAARLFARDGVAATTMAAIADEVGLGVSSLYYYFRNKHDILERIVIDVNRVPLSITEAVRAEFNGAGTRLHAFIQRDAIALCHFPFDINEVHRLAGSEPDGFERYWTDRAQLIEAVTALVVDGIEDGVFRPVDPGLTALTVLANDEAIQNWYRPPVGRVGPTPGVDRPDPPSIGAFLADLTLRGLLAEPDLLDEIRRSDDRTRSKASEEGE